MEIAVTTSTPANATLALVATEPPPARLADLVETGEVTTKRGTARTVLVDGERAIVVGGGPAEEVDADVLRDAAAAVCHEAKASTGGTIAWQLDESLSLPAAEQARALVEGAILGDYDPGAWKTEAREGAVVSATRTRHDDDVAASVGRAETAARWTNRARDLVNRPANDLTPATLAEYAASSRRQTPGLSAEALEPDAMRELGMGALLAVGMGSYNEPRLIVLRWEPPDAEGGDRVLGLVGKGLTFDSGGSRSSPPCRWRT